MLAGAIATVAAATVDGVPAMAAPASGQARRTQAQRDGLRVTAPTVEYVQHPLGIDAQHPRLSWPLASDRTGARQSAYQIRVATTASRLSHPDVWDSGKVTSGESVLVSYGGPDSSPGRATTGPYACGTPTARSPAGARPRGGRPG
jgi:alpha-L-rhamnosidase